MTSERVLSRAILARAVLLQQLGLVHVTGLRSWNVNGSNPDPIQAHKAHLGCWDYNNGKLVVVTVDGEVWLGVAIANFRCCPSHREICPHGQGAFVPCSNGEELSTHSLLRRLASPYDDLNGECSPVPQIKG
jgi:hypothetical protein